MTTTDDDAPANNDVQERIRASFDRQGLMRHLGARLTYIGAGQVRIMLPHRPEITQQHGYIHAGATSAIADSAGGYAALTLFPADAEVLTVVQDQPVGPSRRRPPRCRGHRDQDRPYPDRLPPRGVRRDRETTDARGRGPADPDPPARTVTLLR